MPLDTSHRTPGRERRRHPRVAERDSVAIRVISAPALPELEQKTFFCSSEDLSVGGMRFCVHREVPVEATLELNVALMNPKTSFKHIGQVVWVRQVEQDNPYAVGVRFTSTPPDELLRWKELIECKASPPKKIFPS